MPQLLKMVIVWFSLAAGVGLMLFCNYILEKNNTAASQVSWPARWAGIIAAINTSASIAILLISLTQKVEVDQTTAPIRDQLSGVSYIILAIVLLIIIGGLGWCFYRALTAVSKDAGTQHPDEVGDE